MPSIFKCEIDNNTYGTRTQTNALVFVFTPNRIGKGFGSAYEIGLNMNLMNQNGFIWMEKDS